LFDLIAFDADDTLWENEAHYSQAREDYFEILRPYNVTNGLANLVDDIENRNIPYFGYGVSSFIFSLLEAAIQATNRQISADDVQRILDLGRTMLDTNIDLFDQVEPILQRLSNNFPLMVITKGDLLHQQSKLTRSGLSAYFQNVEIVADKTREVYAGILAKHKILPERFLMVGNSMRSDVLPVLELGGNSVYIPAKMSWAHEHSELPQELGRHFVELEHLGQVEEWIRGKHQ
jgi:putative hydrolase of the HAD superfamily